MITKSLTKNFIFVWDKDPDLDKGADGFADAWKAFEESGDPSGLPVVSGGKLARFVCAPLSMAGYSRVSAEVTDIGRCTEAVRYGLRQVEGFVLDKVELKAGDSDRRRDGRENPLKDEFLEKIWDPNLIVSMGVAIIKNSQLDPTRAQG